MNSHFRHRKYTISSSIQQDSGPFKMERDTCPGSGVNDTRAVSDSTPTSVIVSRSNSASSTPYRRLRINLQAILNSLPPNSLLTHRIPALFPPYAAAGNALLLGTLALSYFPAYFPVHWRTAPAGQTLLQSLESFAEERRQYDEGSPEQPSWDPLPAEAESLEVAIYMGILGGLHREIMQQLAEIKSNFIEGLPEVPLHKHDEYGATCPICWERYEEEDDAEAVRVRNGGSAPLRPYLWAFMLASLSDTSGGLLSTLPKSHLNA